MAEFTIITPVLNGAAHIERCILSVAQQGVDVQHIVMDGGSTDGTVDILRRHGHHLAYWESMPDEGQSHAINKGLAAATGRICNWLNADDELREGALHEVSELMTEDVNVVCGGCAHVNLEGDVLAIGGTAIQSSLEHTLARCSMGQPSHFYRTSAINGLGGLNPALHYAMDMDLWFRYLLKEGQESVTVTDVVFSDFLVHDDGKSQRMEATLRTEKFGLYRALLSEVAKPATVERWLAQFPIINGVEYALPSTLDRSALLRHFSLYLLPHAYAERNRPLVQDLLDVIGTDEEFRTADRFMWELRKLKLRMSR